MLINISGQNSSWISEPIAENLRKLSESFSPDFGGKRLITSRRHGAEIGRRCEIISFTGGTSTFLLEIFLHTDNTTTQIDSETLTDSDQDKSGLKKRRKLVRV